MAPGSDAALVKVAQDDAFHVLKDKVRKVKLEAEQHRDLASRQHEARQGELPRVDDLGMVHIHLELEPHVGAPITARAEAEAQRVARAANAGKTEGTRASESRSSATSRTPTRICSRVEQRKDMPGVRS